MKGLFFCGIVFAVITFPAINWLKTFPWYEIRPSPIFFIQRLGVVFILLYLLSLFCKNRDLGRSYFFDMSRESLLAYWLHLQIIYRLRLSGRSINSIVNQSFGIVECSIATLILLAIVIAAAVIWASIKRKHPEPARKIFILFVICGLIFFCVSK